MLSKVLLYNVKEEYLGCLFCSTTGSWDPIKSALQIVLGKRVCLDIAHIVRWKTRLHLALNPIYAMQLLLQGNLQAYARDRCCSFLEEKLIIGLTV